MIKWTLFIPLTALFFILYFQFLDLIFRGKKKIFKIDEFDDGKPSKREYLNTSLNFLIFALMGFLIGYAIEHGWTRVYSISSFSVKEISYLLASFFLTLLIHDIYFYWTHRLLHQSQIFKYVHVWHHKSHQANSWSAFSFHPIEGILQIGIAFVLLFIFPIHEYILMLFVAFMLFISVYGHSGYELRPNKWKGFLIFNTSLHHYQHHTLIRYNFGIYLNIWDKLFGSDNPEYDEKFEQLSEKIKVKKEQIMRTNREK